MQRLVTSAVARTVRVRSSGALPCCVSPVCTALRTQRRLGSSTTPPPPRPPTAAETAQGAAAGNVNSSDAPELDAKAAEQLRLAQDIGEQAFGENTEILKQVGYRGLRAFVVCAVGMGAFMWAMKRKKRELAAAEEAEKGDEEDPTQRYLEEMRNLGFDVDTLEEELEDERRAKAGLPPIPRPSKEDEE